MSNYYHNSPLRSERFCDLSTSHSCLLPATPVQKSKMAIFKQPKALALNDRSRPRTARASVWDHRGGEGDLP